MRPVGFLVSLFRPKGDAVLGQLFRYAVSGGMASLVDIGLTILLKECFGLRGAWAASLGNLAGLVVTYLLSIFWIFDQRRFSRKVFEILGFAAICLVGLVLTYLFMVLFEDILHIHYIAAKVTVVFLVTVWNFLAKKIWLFTKACEN